MVACTTVRALVALALCSLLPGHAAPSRLLHQDRDQRSNHASLVAVTGRTAKATNATAAEIAAAEKAKADAAMLYAISQEQWRLQNMLDQVSLDINLTQDRAAALINFANTTIINASHAKQLAIVIETAAQTNNNTMKLMIKGFPGINTSLAKLRVEEVKTNETITKIVKDMGDAGKAVKAEKRADDDMDILKMLKPRIGRIVKHVDTTEDIIHNGGQPAGNITKMIDDELEKGLRGAIGDIEDTFEANLPYQS